MLSLISLLALSFIFQPVKGDSNTLIVDDGKTSSSGVGGFDTCLVKYNLDTTTVTQLFVGIHDIFADNTTIIVTLEVENNSGLLVEGASVSATNGSSFFNGLTDDQGQYPLVLSYTPDPFTIQVNASKIGYTNATELFTIDIDPEAVDYVGEIDEVTAAVIFVTIAFITLNITFWGALFYRKRIWGANLKKE
jgi:hypothetical protein